MLLCIAIASHLYVPPPSFVSTTLIWTQGTRDFKENQHGVARIDQFNHREFNYIQLVCVDVYSEDFIRRMVGQIFNNSILKE